MPKKGLKRSTRSRSSIATGTEKQNKTEKVVPKTPPVKRGARKVLLKQNNVAKENSLKENPSNATNNATVAVTQEIISEELSSEKTPVVGSAKSLINAIKSKRNYKTMKLSNGKEFLMLQDPFYSEQPQTHSSLQLDENENIERNAIETNEFHDGIEVEVNSSEDEYDEYSHNSSESTSELESETNSTSDEEDSQPVSDDEDEVPIKRRKRNDSPVGRTPENNPNHNELADLRKTQEY